jgi:hypothetical protein
MQCCQTAWLLIEVGYSWHRALCLLAAQPEMQAAVLLLQVVVD